MELQKLEAMEKHLIKCVDARRVSDWKTVLTEADAAIVSGADFAPQVRIKLCWIICFLVKKNHNLMSFNYCVLYISTAIYV